MGDKPAINTYTCEACGHVITTIDAEEGTTPFMVPCVKCGGKAQSAGYQVSQDRKPDFVWRKLRAGDPVVGENDADHISRGGLVLYHPDIEKWHGRGRRVDVIPGTRVMFHVVTPLGVDLEKLWVGVYYGLQKDRDYEVNASRSPAEVMRRRDAWAAVARVAMEHGMNREREVAESAVSTVPMSESEKQAALQAVGVDAEKVRAGMAANPRLLSALLDLALNG